MLPGEIYNIKALVLFYNVRAKKICGQLWPQYYPPQLLTFYSKQKRYTLSKNF